MESVKFTSIKDTLDVRGRLQKFLTAFHISFSQLKDFFKSKRAGPLKGETMLAFGSNDWSSLLDAECYGPRGIRSFEVNDKIFRTLLPWPFRGEDRGTTKSK